MNTVVEALFQHLHHQTEWMWMDKWTDVEKQQLFAFFVKGYSLSKIDASGELPFEEDPQRFGFLREIFEVHYQHFFKKERPSSDDLPTHVETNRNNDETKKQQQQ
jgi:hypothetical protein